jgi:hypothetical protein
VTLEELFAAGAHHTVESLFARGEFAYRDVAAALERRFGPAGVADPSAVAGLIQNVQNAISSAEMVPVIERPSPLNYGVNPAIPERFQYAVVASLPDPSNPNEVISVPWTINTDSPLTYEEILEQSEGELNEGFQRDDKYQQAHYADLHRRDLALQRIARDEYGGEAPFDIQIIGSYRRG